ncbi:hypothetical protein BpHYR1_001583 [Brachionus plicatilis]|uniref:Uncharacterized protein n=1 Tax=Brachionus plicatilis TaxID=10195 RepID=A0A3M7QK19_BRAPC|nr:hypothetical protein BpHYR1_001583 [Brachionus plicatilis]
MINGAEELKKLAACVNEIKQSDGSVVKEYILNDPKIIEKIRSQIKNQSQTSVDRFSPLPSITSTLTSSTPYLNQVKQQMQKFQSTPAPPPPPPLVQKQKKFEFTTKKGKIIRLSCTDENVTESDCDELREVLKKVECKTEAANGSVIFQSKNPQMIKSGSLDNILDTKPKPPAKSNLPVYLNYLNQAKSIGNLSMPDPKMVKSQENFEQKKNTLNQTYSKSSRSNYYCPKINEPIHKKFNKSLDNLDSLEQKEKNITSEMTEQLLLKLLLHQISLQKEEKNKKVFDDEDEDGTSQSADTLSSSSSNSKSKINNFGARMVAQSSASANVSSGSGKASSNVSSTNINLTKNKKMLFQKSMSNFNFHMAEPNESDMDEFEQMIHKKNMNQFNAARNKLKQNFF